MPFPTVAGHKCHYVHRRLGSKAGPPVVFIHGAGGTHQHWLYQVRDVPRVPTYALDLPGHGRSEGPGEASINSYSSWLMAFLDAVDLDQAVLVGHSMGGAIALDAALRYPSRIAGLGLVATGARLRVAPAILEGILQDQEEAVRLICNWAYGPKAPEETVQLGRRQMGETPAQVLHGDFVACDRFDVLGRLKEIKSPTLIVCGAQDRMTPSKDPVYLQDHIAGATLHLVEGAGHMVMIEQPAAVVEALTLFLKGLS